MLPWKLFWDWQHNFCSSGGIAQYHVNSFCHALLDIIEHIKENAKWFFDPVKGVELYEVKV